LGFCGAQLNQIEIRAELEDMRSNSLGERVSKLVTAFDAIHGGVGLAAEIGVARDVDADVATARLLRIAKVQAAAGKLKTKLVDRGVTEDGVVLEVTSRSRDWLYPAREPEFCPNT